MVMTVKTIALYSTLIRLANSYGKEMDDGILISVPECENCSKEICNIE